MNNTTKIFIADLDSKLKLVFDIFDYQSKGKIGKAEVEHILKHCNFEGLQEDTEI